MPPTSSKARVLFSSITSNLVLEELDFLTVGGTFIRRLKMLSLYPGIFWADFPTLLPVSNPVPLMLAMGR